MTDTRKSSVYDAESVVLDMVDRRADVEFHGARMTPDDDRKFGQVSDVARYLAWLRGHDWGHPDVPPPVVRVRRGESKATWEAPGTIAIPDSRWARRELIILHEYAHHVVWHTWQDSSHGARFCRVLADLVRNAVGQSTGLLLTDSFHRGGLFED